MMEKLEPEGMKKFLSFVFLTEQSAQQFTRNSKIRMIKKAIKLVEAKVRVFLATIFD